MSKELAKYEAACKAISEAKTTDEIMRIRDTADRWRAAARIAENKDLEVDAAEIRLRAERHLGELMCQQRETVGLNKGTRGQLQGKSSSGVNKTPPENQPPTLDEAGIDKNLAKRARKLAAVPDDEFEEHIEGWRGRVEQENERVRVDLFASGDKHIHNHRAQGTGENEWYTPEEYIEKARELMGGIDLDPASSAKAQKVVQADSYYSPKDNGLEKEWYGRIWLNPPYSQPLIAQFIERFAQAVEQGEIEQAIVLTHNYTDTSWFHRAEGVSDLICFTRGRIAFVNQDGEHAQPTQGQAFFYVGKEKRKFRSVFKEVGFIR